jgi:glycine betaine/choline ABC-type transport system substrate-binding protein
MAATALIAGLALLSGCGGDDGGDADGPGSGTSLTVADKGFSESSIVAQLYAQALEAQGFDVEVTSLASTEIADGAIREGEIDLYPEYTGTAFLNVLGNSAADAPDDPAGVYDAVADAYTARGLTTLPPSPFDNRNEVACTSEAVEEYDLQTLSDLGRASGSLVYSANAEHLTRDDGLPLLSSEYGVDFRDVITVDISLRYRPIEDGDAQCVYAFTTDPSLATIDLQLLEDDKGLFKGVAFQNFPVVNTAFLEGLSDEARTALESTLGSVNELLTDEEIRGLTAKVDFDQEDPRDVADDFLAENLEPAA